jgi:uncharacterized protein (DUF1499 family)
LLRGTEVRALKWLAIAIALLVAAGIGAGRLGWLQGTPPHDLGVKGSRLKPPSLTPNSVSSQAALYPDHPRRVEAQIAPLHYEGDGAAAMARLAQFVETTDGVRIVRRDADYVYATYTTPLMRYVDDVEFWLDPAGGVIHVRSASRIGESDLGANRARIEALRARFEHP